jgi:HD superfamily phosphohydrolase
LELLHTPLFQRLYDLKQLGYSDRVFPDAVHSRFNHLIGVAEIAERMALRLEKWLYRQALP